MTYSTAVVLRGPGSPWIWAWWWLFFLYAVPVVVLVLCGFVVGARSSVDRRGKGRDRGTQTDTISIPAYWEWSAIDLKAAARARNMDSGLLKKELIVELVRAEVNAAQALLTECKRCR